MTSIRTTLVFASILAILLMTGCGGSRAAAPPVLTARTTPHPCGKAQQRPARYAHVIWIVMENKARDAVIGSREAPYENALATQCAQAVHFAAEAHPSLPNYIAMTSGSTHGISDDGPPSSHPLSGPSIFSQLGAGWRALQQSMRSPCAHQSSAIYAAKHNPAAYFKNIRGACARQDVPLGRSPDLSARFTFVTPNRCNDTHDCSVATGDRWLKRFLGQVFASREYTAGGTAVFLTWDEDDSGGGNHIPTIVAAPGIMPGTSVRRAYNHYSMLRTTEEMLGLRLIGEAARAASMRSAFGI